MGIVTSKFSAKPIVPLILDFRNITENPEQYRLRQEAEFFLSHVKRSMNLDSPC